MAKKKIDNIELEDKIFEIVDYARVSLSIRQITLKLNKEFGILVSPQIVKRYLLKLKKEGRIVGI